MRKLFISVLAILLVVGIAGYCLADNIPSAVDPKNYSVVWTANVYNGSGSDVTSGYIVEWDFDTADSTALDGTWFDDQCPYVQLVDAAGDIWTAGVVPYGKNLVDGDTGSIIIRGPTYVLIGSALTADDIVEADANGLAAPHDGAAVDEGTLGVCIKATTTNGPGTGGLTDFGVIFINPTQYDKD